jgi:Carbohydrate esterase 2 N-terminal
MALLYSSNFDSTTVGTLPAGWSDIDSAGWQVVTLNPVSGARAMGLGTLVDGMRVIYTGIAAMTDFDVVHTTKVINGFGSSNPTQNFSPMLRAAADGSEFYMWNPQWVGGAAYLYRWDGTFHLVDSGPMATHFADGDVVNIRAQVQGSTFRFKVWHNGTSEPGTWDVTLTDSALMAAGYAGQRAGSGSSGSNVGPVTSFDDFSISDFSVPSRTSIALTDTNLFFSPYTWNLVGGKMQTNASGAYLKFGFTGTSIEIDFGDAVAGNTVKYSVDGRAVVSYIVPATGGQISVGGLSAGTHQFKMWVTMCTQGSDAWVTPVSIVAVSEISVDNGSSSAAPAGTLSGRQMFCGDSITAAVAGTGGDATFGWAPIVAQAIGAEYGQRGYGGIGWVMNNGAAGVVADVVPFFTPGDDTNSHWNKYDASHSLLSGGLFSPAPDDIFLAFGTNDGLAGASDASVQASVAGGLAALRGAAPAARIWAVIPFGGFKAAAITAGFNQFWSATLDRSVYLIDLGTDANLTGSISLETADGYHPNLITYATKAAAIVEARRKKLNGGGINGSGILGMI